jgi:deltex-like protein
LEAVTIGNDAGKEQECPICLENMAPTSDAGTTDVICIKICQHRFHKHCIMDMFDRGIDKCPNCRQKVGIEPRGKGPSGSMNIIFNPRRRCKGFEHNSDGVIEMHYKMQSGIQLASRIAYLPHNEIGRKLLARLKYAFTHGLTFRVGTSLTSGRSNQITWTSIQHKTSLRSGPFGYPDPQYFTDCNDSLDALRVPKAEDCA